MKTKKKTRLNPGVAAWLGLAAYVAAYDVWAILGQHRTLSRTFYDGLHSRYTGGFVTAVWVLVTLHLFDIIPDSIDPIHSILTLIEPIIEAREA